VRFYLGTHHASQRWFDLEVPLFVSRRTLAGRRALPRAHRVWALDSGAFTELAKHGRWATTEAAYIADVHRFRAEVGRLAWVAPMDWPCEPAMLTRTGLTIADPRRRTVDNFVRLRDRLGELVAPVIQGWTLDDYLRCWEQYHAAGVDLEREPTIGVGTVCRRQDTAEAGTIVRRLAGQLLGRQLHAFGVKVSGLASFGDVLASADSMAWSYNGRRRSSPCPEGRANCANCIHHALGWRAQLLARLDQLHLEGVA
jgi:hypothetical protein